MARHEAPPNTFDATVSDYVTGRAKELVRQFDRAQNPPPIGCTPQVYDWAAWIGSAAEILRELTRDA